MLKQISLLLPTISPSQKLTSSGYSSLLSLVIDSQVATSRTLRDIFYIKYKLKG